MTDYPMYIDRRDEEVVKRLDVGKVYSVTTVKKMYKRYTDIRRESTAKERKKALLQTPCFENVGIGQFRFVGVDE